LTEDPESRIASPRGERYSDRIDSPSMNVTGDTIARRPAGRRPALRALALLLLASVALVPTLARAHDRLDRQRTPAQQHSRFRWTNSCESVPQKSTNVVVVQPLEGPAPALLQPPLTPHHWTPTDPLTPASPPFVAPRPVRAPPAVLS
jgi:hypothetical protein